MQTPFLFTDQHVFIAGGTSGINYGIAQGFARAGARLTVLSRNQAKVDTAVAGLQDLAFRSVLEAGDVLMTGTPAGVGAVGPRDGMVGRITGLTPINVTITGAAQGA